MELLGNLKDKVSKAQSKEEARELIESAGMKLTDKELDMVAGGAPVTGRTSKDPRESWDDSIILDSVVKNASRGPLIP